MDRAQLADFLRRRREALLPRDVGFAAGVRRRTQGLRREEVALLAGMSTDYYSRLEQQRGSQPSEQMVAAIARALRLQPDERDHLYLLAGHQAPARPGPSAAVHAATLRILDRLHDTPAVVISNVGETLAQNRLAVALLGDASGYTGLARSFVWRWFADPAARLIYPEADHERHSRVLVSNLRAAYVRRGQDPFVQEIVTSLAAASPEFVALWERHEVAVRRMDTKRIVHPELGVIELDCQGFVAESETQKLLVYTAAPGSHAAEQLETLARREGILTSGI
ncbi:helix-turn-helix transcriptional regulator [Phytohabitans flavus]|uniref:XRE family transcriptional regulator n=1 Tax=Phytohabitans flavus TaxID=1076124 RepID=A0A6F8XJ95_9ACTN|nr:helix-turn-helix transcriptional regulator [Phytohabitans flavus]BCB73868.1 XRE family transcriptional regulator [Phytohabitans flavus]